ncbi:MAG: hypothetical protein NW205_07425 [Hyphomicrobiaceae bacterium]|nr:hypothetical protein [Hyphomicrobiaceae bacterium]
MTASSFVMATGLSIAAAALLGLALLIGLGERWFEFYGAAITLVTFTVLLSVLLWRRFGAVGLSRWPILGVAAPAILAGLVQAGFWLAYFEGGPAFAGLGIARGMVLDWIELLVPLLAVGIACGAAALIARGVLTR